MRAGLRFGIAAFAAGLALGPLPALAQAAPEPGANPPAAESIGPRELQNFSLNGTVTREADAPPPAPAQRTPARSAENAQASGASPGAAATQVAGAATPRRPNPTPSAPTSGARPADGSALALDLSTATPATAVLPTSLPQPGFSTESTPSPLASEQGPELWPWLLLAALLGVGGAVLLRRRRSREAFAGGPHYDAFVAPEAAAPPRAAPPPTPAPAPKTERPKPVGIVSSRLRPWLDIAFAPLGCVVDDDRVVVEFDVQLTNSGAAPARDVLVEASMFNAGATQDQDIGAFFANPVGQGERIDVIAPLQNITIRTSLVAPRANIRIFEMGGRQVFVPLVAFNVLYRAGTADGQTSSAYLLGRETNGEKLGPLRSDLGAKAFANLGVRPLPIGVRN